MHILQPRVNGGPESRNHIRLSELEAIPKGKRPTPHFPHEEPRPQREVTCHLSHQPVSWWQDGNENPYFLILQPVSRLLLKDESGEGKGEK